MCSITFNWERGDFEEKFREFKGRGKNPLWAVIDITDVCEFNCEWCYARDDKRGVHMERETLSRLIDYLASSGIMQITFSGGEPTSYPYLLWAVKEARNRGMIVHMNTNSYKLDRSLLMKLKRAGLSQIEVNIDSLSPEKHDRIRGKKGSFERTVNAILDANDLGITTVIQTVTTTENQEEVMNIMDFALSLGAKRIRIWDMLLSGSAKKIPEKVPRDYLETLKRIAEFAKQKGAVSIKAADPMFPLGYDTGMDILDTTCVCAMGLVINISPRGDTYFCCTTRDVLYNIFDVMEAEHDLRRIHKQKLSEYLKSRGIHEDCKSCERLDKCGGGCLSRTPPGGKDYLCSV